MKKLFWVEINPFDEKILSACLESGVDGIFLPKGFDKIVKKQSNIKTIGEDCDLVLKRDVKIFEITKKEDEDLVVKENGKIPVIIKNKDWTIIPLENLMSKTSNLIQTVSNHKDAKTALQVMERGADGILLQTNKVNEIKKTRDVIDEIESEKLDLEIVKIVSTEEVIMSDRCCIDTTSMLDEGTGILAGNSNNAMFLVHNENVESEFCAKRPFRVNVGAVHAYVKLPNNKTKYLCELESGDEVLVVDKNGNTKKVAVGRNKIERRPMINIKAISKNGIEFSLVMQLAETIRLVNKEGKPVSVAKLKKGDEVIAYVHKKIGRHFGETIEETITEK